MTSRQNAAEDRYENAVVEKLRRKQVGMPRNKEAPASAPSTVVSLMDALKRSIQQERPAAEKTESGEKVGKPPGRQKAG